MRIDKNNAPKEMVQRYVHRRWRSRSSRPSSSPRTSTSSTATHASRPAGSARSGSANALVIPIAYTDADEDTRERVRLLGKLLNNANGKPLDRTERKLMIRDALALGMTERQMTGTVGFPPSIVRSVTREVARYQDALVRVGLDENLLKGTVLGTVGMYAELHDEPLRELAQLTADANFGAKEVKGLAVDAKRAASDDEALRIIRHAREGAAQRIEDVARGGAGKPKQSKQLRQRLGFITARDADVLIETDPTEMAEHLDALENAMSVLNTTITRQRELLEAAS